MLAVLLFLLCSAPFIAGFFLLFRLDLTMSLSEALRQPRLWIGFALMLLSTAALFALLALFS